MEQPTASVTVKSTVPPSGTPETVSWPPLDTTKTSGVPSPLLVIVKFVPSTRAFPPFKPMITSVEGTPGSSQLMRLLNDISGLK